ncbi:MAG: S-methyl-5'-thioinosine phosphorylase [Thiohalocapsa sp.]|nr:S-methyl-5'-thioinosine phosphorylase [Thiohalocapsa sp.]
MGQMAIIGGSGFAAALPELEVDAHKAVQTAYGTPSAALVQGRLADRSVVFLARHGDGHRLPPHKVNYRANIQALSDAGVDRIIALAAVGGISDGFGPLALCVPDQIVDYTHGRESSFHDGGDDGGEVVHIDFSYPFSASLRGLLLDAGRAADIPVTDGATYAVTQGPRLETAAEINRLERDGCDIVGMTLMPEAALARERGIAYGCLAFVVNWAAGKGEGEIGMDEIRENLDRCQTQVRRLLVAAAGSSAD